MLECGLGRRVMEAVSIALSNVLLIVTIQNSSIFRGVLALSDSFEFFILSENVYSSSNEPFSVPGIFCIEIGNLGDLPNRD
jgi:hypothetical protein